MSTYEFRLPDVGEGLEEAEIIEWLVAPGDSIRRDQPMVEILTDKSQTELPAPTAGVVAAIHPEVGEIAKVGDLLIEIATDSDQPAPPAPPAPTAVPAEPQPASAPGPAAASSGVRPKASPAVRRRAREAGVDLSTVTGTGPGGRITDQDLVAARSAPGPVAGRATISTTPAPSTDAVGQMPIGEHPLRGIRRVTARAMENSWSIPHIHGMDEIDATNLLAGRAKIKELLRPAGDGLTPLAFLVTAVARALRRFPIMNASIDTEAGSITVHDRVDIGIAVASDDGLIVPVIRDADRRDLMDLATEISRLSAAARSRTIDVGELRNGTCTISNYGSLGGRFATPIIRSPEVAIVGFGAIRQRPFVVDGAVAARPTLPIATGADHRLIDGDVLTAFQEHIAGLLTHPVSLMVA